MLQISKSTLTGLSFFSCRELFDITNSHPLPPASYGCVQLTVLDSDTLSDDTLGTLEIDLTRQVYAEDFKDIRRGVAFEVKNGDNVVGKVCACVLCVCVSLSVYVSVRMSLSCSSCMYVCMQYVYCSHALPTCNFFQVCLALVDTQTRT